MSAKSSKVKKLFVLLIIGMFSMNILCYITNSIYFSGNQSLNDYEKGRNDIKTSNLPDSEPQYGGYNVSNVASFDVIESASSIINKRDFKAVENKYFNNLVSAYNKTFTRPCRYGPVVKLSVSYRTASYCADVRHVISECIFRNIRVKRVLSGYNKR